MGVPKKDLGVQAVAKPFVKWAGSKTQLLPVYRDRYPSTVPVYHEPFLGAGAVFFDIQARFHPTVSHLSDTCAELIHTFEVVRDDVEHLIKDLERHKRRHSKKHYYEVRDGFVSGDVATASRFIYLNKTCFNGLYRVNAAGKFNVPMGDYANPRVVDPSGLMAVSRALSSRVTLRCQDYHAVLKRARPGHFVYLDPPYQPLSTTSNFTRYTENGFAEDDQRELCELFCALDRRQCKVMLSNSDHPLIRSLYARFNITPVQAVRRINSKGSKRGSVTELIVRNYA